MLTSNKNLSRMQRIRTLQPIRRIKINQNQSRMSQIINRKDTKNNVLLYSSFIEEVR